METAKKLANTVLETVSSGQFKKEEIQQHDLTLSQGYCLLWQDAESGDLCGRKCNPEANAGATAAVLVDLVVLGKGEIEVMPDAASGVKDELPVFKVVSEKSTGTYLDSAIFDRIAKQCDEHPQKTHYVKDIIYEDISQKDADQRCTTKTLDSLVERGIFLMETTYWGRKYSTAKPDVEKELVKDIRAVALDGAEPSSYVRALLTLARNADSLCCLNNNPVLKKHFSEEEYRKAKERFNGLAGLDKNSKGN